MSGLEKYRLIFGPAKTYPQFAIFAAFCGVLRRFAAFCGVLRCFAVFCGVLRCFAAFCGVLQCFAVFCGVLRRFLAFCKVMRHFSAFYGVFWLFAAFCGVLWHFAAFCGVLWHFAAFCGILQRFTVFCSVLQRSAVFCGILRHFAARWRKVSVAGPNIWGGGQNPAPFSGRLKIIVPKRGGQWPRSPPENIFLVSSRLSLLRQMSKGKVRVFSLIYELNTSKKEDHQNRWKDASTSCLTQVRQRSNSPA
jgi:hypothetical protein